MPSKSKYNPVLEEVELNGTEQEAAQEEQKEVDKFTLTHQVEQFLEKGHEFRFNLITGFPEYRHADDNDSGWQQMNDFYLNSLVRDMKKRGIKASKGGVGELLESDFSNPVNPIKQYFEDARKDRVWDGKTDHIKELCSTVQCDCPEGWFEKYFKKWIVACVANVFIENRCANHTCFVIVSDQQGWFKSTWIQNLVPPQLINYYKEEGLDPENKDSLFACTTNLIYNLDDYFADVTKKKVNALKGFITKSFVKARRPYARFEEKLPKICSFIGSSNEETFLSDPTGSRRFLPFKLAARIEINKANDINKDFVWAQAYGMFLDGFRYWLDGEETKEMADYSNSFQIQTVEYEIVSTYFEKPEQKEKAEMHLSNTEIKTLLERYTSYKLGSKRIGQALKDMGIERWRRVEDNGTRKWVYSVNMLSESQVKINRSGQQNYSN